MGKLSDPQFRALLALVVPIAISVPLIAGFFGSLHPVFDSFGHFRAHLAVLMALAAVPALFLGMRKEALATWLLALSALSTTSPALSLPGLGQVNAGFHDKDGSQAVYRLLQLNLRFDNKTPEKVLSLIGRSQPDIVTLDEVSTFWIGQLERISAAYPHRIICETRGRTGGVAILSRRPFAETTSPACLNGGAFAIARVDLGGRVIDVAALHLHWPWPFGQSGQIERLVPALGTLRETAILAGDFNAAGWSASVARVGAAGALTRIGSIGPTWLVRGLPKGLRGWIGLPIDQVMTKGGILIHSAATMEDAGSDHAPVLVEFSLSVADTIPDEEDVETTTVERTESRLPRG